MKDLPRVKILTIASLFLFIAAVFVFAKLQEDGILPENDGYTYNSSRERGIDTEEIKRNMENMSKEEIKETIKKIEEEIERIKSELRQ